MRIAGVDIGGGTLKAGIFDTVRGLVHCESFPTPKGDPEKIVRLVCDFVGEMGAQRLGVGTAGSVNARTGLVYAGNLHWKGVPLRGMLQEALNIPVWVDNDAQAALMAEAYDGVCKGFHDVIYLTLGTGIGGAALINGKPWRGYNYTALELGHMVTHADGLPCVCTRVGCFEMYASAQALSRMADGLPPEKVLQAVQAGDAAMTLVFAQYLHELAVGLVSVISIFNPERIVLGGGLSKAGSILLTGVREEVARLLRNRPEFFEGDIVLSVHQNEGGMIGAAVLANLYGLDEPV